ncbi:hypothetical protein LR002_03290 [Candidatus Gracilibacteria bacterium]|nr:hypothetical protein [Candidatus Gracilibacteria bacterium]
MLIKNLILSGFAEKNFFDEKKVFFAMENGVGEGRVEDVKENKIREKTDKLKFSVKHGHPEEEFSFFSKSEGGAEASYLTREKIEKQDLLKNYILFSTGNLYSDAIEKKKDDVKKDNEEIDKQIAELRGKQKEGDLSNGQLLNSLISALEDEKERNNKILSNDFDLLRGDLENDFKRDVENLRSNFDNFFEGERDKIEGKISEIENLSRSIGSDIPVSISTKINGLHEKLNNFSQIRDKFFGENGKMNFDVFKKEMRNFGANEYNREFDKLKRKYSDKSDYDIGNEAFDNIVNRFFDDYFKGFDDIDYSKITTDVVLDEIDKEIEFGKLGKTFEDCQNMCNEIPGFEGKCDEIFESKNSVDLSVLDGLFSDSEKEEVGYFNKVKDELEKSEISNKNNLFLTGKMFVLMSKLRDLIFHKMSEEPSLKKFIETNNLDLNNYEDRIKLKEKFLEKVKLEGIKLDFSINYDDDQKHIEQLDVTGLKHLIFGDIKEGTEGDIQECYDANKVFFDKKNADFILGEKTNDGKEIKMERDRVKGIYEGNNKFLNYLDEYFKGEFDKLHEMENVIKGETDPIKKDYHERLLKDKLNHLKNDYLQELLSVKKTLLASKADVINLKNEHEKYLKEEGPQAVSIASIWHMMKEVYGEWKGNKDFGREVERDLQAGVMAKSIGQGMGFTDALNKGEALLKNTSAKMNKFYGENKEKYSSFDTKGLKDELNNFAKRGNGDFNGTALYGVLANMVDKGIFNKDNIDFLIALHRKTGFLGDKGTNYEDLKVAAINFVKSKSELDKINILTPLVGDLFENSDLYGEWTQQSINNFEKNGEKATSYRAAFKDQPFIDYRNEYLKVANDNGLLERNGCIKDGLTVPLDNVGQIDNSMYKKRLNNFVLQKIVDGKLGFYALLEGIGTGMIPKDLAVSHGFEGGLADTFGWLDKFKKSLIPYDKLRGMFARISKPIKDGGKPIFYTYGENLNLDEEKNNRIINKRIGLLIKELSDEEHTEVDKSFRTNPKKSKWWMETVAGKVSYDTFEADVIGKGNNIGMRNPDDLSAFINGIGYELETFGVDGVDDEGNYTHKNNITNLDKNLIKESFKSFLAYNSWYIEKSYNDKGKGVNSATTTIDDFFDKKPAKYAGTTLLGQKPTLKDQAKTFYNIFKEIDKGGIVCSELEKKTGETRDNYEKRVSDYFGRGSGKFVSDMNDVFSSIDNKELLEIIIKAKKSSDFPQRV